MTRNRNVIPIRRQKSTAAVVKPQRKPKTRREYESYRHVDKKVREQIAQAGAFGLSRAGAYAAVNRLKSGEAVTTSQRSFVGRVWKSRGISPSRYRDWHSGYLACDWAYDEIIAMAESEIKKREAEAKAQVAEAKAENRRLAAAAKKKAARKRA